MTSLTLGRVARGVVPPLVACTVLASAPRAWADEAAAREHFRRGVALYDEKRFAEAERAFREAYAEKPSAGIKQNIALSLKGQGKLVEAASTFDEALDEGKTTLKPETRAAIERELADIAKRIGTVVIHVVSADDKRPIDNATVTVDGKPRPWRRPIRLSPAAIHLFHAHADGFPDPAEKKLAPDAGEVVDVTFEIAASSGTLTIRPSIAEAIVRVDGTEVGRGVWTSTVTAGTHRVEVSAPDAQTTTVDVTVPAGAVVEQEVVLRPPTEAPPAYAPVRAPPPAKPKRFYVAPMLAVQGASYRLAPGLDEAPDGRRRDLSGFAVGVKGGIRLSRFLAPELHAEVGSMSVKYKLHDGDTLDSETSVSHWQITPAIRFTSPGPVRFTSGTGIGVHGISVEGKLVTPSGNVTKRGSGTTFSWLVDAGLQVDAGPVFFEGVVFFDVHGVGTARAEDTGDRLLQASPATRIGLRLGLGIPF